MIISIRNDRSYTAETRVIGCTRKDKWQRRKGEMKVILEDQSEMTEGTGSDMVSADVKDHKR